MSIALFKDTVTLYYAVPSNPSSCIRKKIGRVKLIENRRSDGSTSVLYIPIYGKRSCKYLPPSELSDKATLKNIFTVRPGDRFVPGISTADTPPEGAYTVTSVDEKRLGSLRIRHIKVLGSYAPPSEEETA